MPRDVMQLRRGEWSVNGAPRPHPPGESPASGWLVEHHSHDLFWFKWLASKADSRAPGASGPQPPAAEFGQSRAAPHVLPCVPCLAGLHLGQTPCAGVARALPGRCPGEVVLYPESSLPNAPHPNPSAGSSRAVGWDQAESPELKLGGKGNPRQSLPRRL